MLDATPSDRAICYTPRGKRGLYGNAPISATEAFSGSDKSRVGFQNQCFLTDSQGDYHTNEYRGPTPYMATDGLYVPQIAVADPNCGYLPTGDQFIAELDAGHWDHIAAPTEALGKTSDTDPEVVRVLKSVGYRFRLISASLPNSVAAGQASTLAVTLVNDNGGTLYNARKIEVILRHQTTGEKFVQDIIGDQVGNRLYFPSAHETKTWTLAFTPPASLPAGPYDVLLNLPDPYVSLHDRPEYSIRLANQNTWEAATGYNKLGHTLQVTPPTVTAVRTATAPVARLAVTPNPMPSGHAPLRAQYEAPGRGWVRVQLLDLLGRVRWNQERLVQAGPNSLLLPAVPATGGPFLLRVTAPGQAPVQQRLQVQ
ncbi:DUF4832 domain-containing protein [Hymenobacter sp. BT664]|uniref:DUF4832 domain-containing protein n=1 Tax=Hymenobacter montanus TaxID=2771359 RepID=A0A927BCP4_9BACT|nr:DUF4832 domain-containing protein [Hymenobacter montanus]MBD2767850.1 DUF4832 domain-containing protein [Hymenobacter montanus]